MMWSISPRSIPIDLGGENHFISFNPPVIPGHIRLLFEFVKSQENGCLIPMVADRDREDFWRVIRDLLIVKCVTRSGPGNSVHKQTSGEGRCFWVYTQSSHFEISSHSYLNSQLIEFELPFFQPYLRLKELEHDFVRSKYEMECNPEGKEQNTQWICEYWRRPSTRRIDQWDFWNEELADGLAEKQY